jgi:hypothetical protein
VVSVNFGNNSIGIAHDEAAAGIKYIGMDRIRAFECKNLKLDRRKHPYGTFFLVGNEADHYAGGSRPAGWSSASYTQSFLNWTTILQQNLSLPSNKFQAGSFAEDPINGYDFTTANIIKEGILNSNAVELFNQHM